MIKKKIKVLEAFLLAFCLMLIGAGINTANASSQEGIINITALIESPYEVEIDVTLYNEDRKIVGEYVLNKSNNYKVKDSVPYGFHYHIEANAPEVAPGSIFRLDVDESEYLINKPLDGEQGYINIGIAGAEEDNLLSYSRACALKNPEDGSFISGIKTREEIKALNEEAVATQIPDTSEDLYSKEVEKLNNEEESKQELSEAENMKDNITQQDPVEGIEEDIKDQEVVFESESDKNETYENQSKISPLLTAAILMVVLIILIIIAKSRK